MRILIGTYTRGTASDGIYSAALNLETGALSTPRLVARTENPSWLLVESGLVVAANEIADAETGGQLSVFRVSGDTLDELQRLPSHGADPCHLACRDNRLAAANYSGGTVALYEWTERGIGSLLQVLTHELTGPHPRQVNAHPHGVYFIEAELQVPDLGADRIYRYNPADGCLLGTIELPAGCGPRHLTRTGEYLVTELHNTVLRIRDGQAQQSVSTLPPMFRGSSSTAEIQSFGGRLYVSNRGHDSIAVLETDPLSVRESVSSGGRHPRHFMIDPGGRWLLVANRDSNSIVSLALDDSGGLSEPISETACPAPVHLLPWP